MSTPARNGTSASPETKRRRKNGKSDDSSTSSLSTQKPLETDSIVSPTVLSHAGDIAKSYKTAKPFPHGLISDMFLPGFLEKVLHEIKHNSKVKFKESDLFRVYQSIDLANLKHESDDARAMPNLMKLRTALYSSTFQSFIERICDLPSGTLVDKVDCAANCHVKGCHLLCHDDVIGTRKVSYILYLTDPKEPWTDQDGGQLELYDSTVSTKQEGEKTTTEEEEMKRVPNAFPSKTLLPIFNSMAFFVVSPGESFHSVQEVFGDRPRLSIQGWYHADKPPSRIEQATLSRLKSKDDGDKDDPYTPFDSEQSNTIPTPATAAAAAATSSTAEPLPEEDSKFLSEYINDTYLTTKSLNEIRKSFEEESSVRLRHFLKDDWASKLKLATMHKDEEDGIGRGTVPKSYRIGMDDGWKEVGPAHKQRFLQFCDKEEEEDVSSEAMSGMGENKPTTPIGPLLSQIKTKLFQSKSFARLLKLMTSLSSPHGYKGKIRRFRPGLDYTVAHYGLLTDDAVLDATLCFVAGNGDLCQYDEATNELIGSDDDAQWESGDVGGFECYIEAEDEGKDDDDDDDKKEEAPDEYDEEGDSNLLSVSASNNTLSLVLRDPGAMRFIKYVGSGAPSSRWDITMEYEVDVDDDENDDSDREEEEECNASANKD